VLTAELKDGPILIREESLEILLNCLPDRVLSRSDRDAAHRVRKAGNKALHSSDASSQEEPWEVLSMTMGLLQRLQRSQ
jgi:hypothetical protein